MNINPPVWNVAVNCYHPVPGHSLRIEMEPGLRRRQCFQTAANLARSLCYFKIHVSQAQNASQKFVRSPSSEAMCPYVVNRPWGISWTAA